MTTSPTTQASPNQASPNQASPNQASPNQASPNQPQPTISRINASLDQASLQHLQRDANAITLKPGQLEGILETAIMPAAAFDTAVVSWNASTPTGSSLQLELRARQAGKWSRYYPLALWTSQTNPERHSFKNTSDQNGRINTDTLELKRKADALQVRVRLKGQKPNTSPSLNAVFAVMSDSKRHHTAKRAAPDKSVWGFELPVPTHSQMIYPNGGEVWCSPTSVTMILGYWQSKRTDLAPLADTVPEAAQQTWDSNYQGTGNWPFNTAYAASKGLRARVDRLSNLSEAETFIKQGVPLALSIGWKAGELPGVHANSSRGHLVVLRGFTKGGQPIVNDPAAKTDAGVRTVYPRAAFERAWIGHSGGIAYVIQP